MLSVQLDDISFDQVMAVSLSWSDVKKIQNYESILGELILRSLFDVAPTTTKIFKYDSRRSLKDDPSLARHSKIIVDMVDIAVNMLGPDLSDLDDGLVAMGRRHINYGVQPKDLPAMGTSLVYALQKVLGVSMTSKVQHAWSVIFSYMITKMSQGLEEAFQEMEMLQ